MVNIKGMVKIVLEELVKKMVMCLSLIRITNDDDENNKNRATNLHDLFETVNQCEDHKPIGYSHLHYSLHPP